MRDFELLSELPYSKYNIDDINLKYDDEPCKMLYYADDYYIDTYVPTDENGKYSSFNINHSKIERTILNFLKIEVSKSTELRLNLTCFDQIIKKGKQFCEVYNSFEVNIDKCRIDIDNIHVEDYTSILKDTYGKACRIVYVDGWITIYD